ncbi:MAG TPA: cytochrome c [Noviherbaspirillum sp.]|nr:cytochrome c [Noviherbaspirillum sp.]
MKRLLFFILAAIIAVPAAIIGLDYVRDPGSDEPSIPVANPAEQIARGAYLARAGDCMACHTARGGEPYAGGRAIPTPFGSIFAPNITPEATTGIGKWSADDLWRALHNGKSKDGQFLYPAFPYPNYTKVTRADSDALHAYLRTLKPVKQPNKEHELRFPYNQRILLAFWRTLYFKPESFRPDTKQSAEWNRGAYLVQGLGHCSACHTSRNALGATDVKAELSGGMIPMLNWYASPLTSGAEAGLGEWEIQHIAALLKTGVSPRGAVFGPMAEVVRESLQHLSDADISAMAVYLKSLPQTEAPATQPSKWVSPQDTEYLLKLGSKVYEKHCVECHQANGEGVPPAYPPLAGSRSLTAHTAINPVRIVVNGGYPPSTAGNPRPYGMPPFGPVLSDTEVAAVVSYLRNAWGNRGELVTPTEVERYRGVPTE